MDTDEFARVTWFTWPDPVDQADGLSSGVDDAVAVELIETACQTI
ncbi:MAG: hypothetical protein NVS4B2_21720 [Chloroflexota bacterium]